MQVDPVVLLADHVCDSRFEQLPSQTVELTRTDVLDTVGCAIGGTGAPGIAELLTLLGRWGGLAEAGVLLSPLRLPAPQAALANGTIAHALDFDDSLDRGGFIHPGAPVFAAALAAADCDPTVSGREFLTAVTLGLDVACRISLAAPMDTGWHRTAVMGVFGCVAAAGKILRLQKAQMTHAFGLAYSHASGEGQSTLDGALAKRLQAGQAAGSGVFSALLAREGFTGARNVFSGRFGFFQLYQRGEADLGALVDGLGTVWRGNELSFKPYPCGRILHGALDAALALRKATAISPSDIVSVTVHVDPVTYHEQFEGGIHKHRPSQVVEAQFALPYLLAAGLVRGTIGFDELSAFADADILALSERVTGTSVSGRRRGWARVELVLTDGRLIAEEVDVPLGSPANPLSTAQHQQKFRACAAVAERPLSEDRISDILQTITRLEHLPRASMLLETVNGQIR